MDPTSPEAFAAALRQNQGNLENPGNVSDANRYMAAYLHGGVPGALNEAGVQTPNWMSAPKQFFDSPDIQTALGIFAGPNSKTANLDKLQHANWMWNQGKHLDDIYNRTGWFRGLDNFWRYQIPGASRAFLRPGGATKLADKLDYPELYKAFPDFENANIEYDLSEGHGQFDPKSGSIIMPYSAPEHSGVAAPDKGLLIHEAEHKVQHEAGFNRGAMPSTFYKFLREERPKTPIGDIDLAARQTYWNHAGEAEARAAQKSSMRDEEYSQNVPPWKRWDVPVNEQILGPKIGVPRAIPTDDDYIRALKSYYHGLQPDPNKLRSYYHDPKKLKLIGSSGG